MLPAGSPMPGPFWRLEYLIDAISITKHTVSTILVTGPTFLTASSSFFKLGLHRDPLHVAELLHAIERLKSQNKISDHQYAERSLVLGSLRESGKYPVKWIVRRLVELEQANCLEPPPMTTMQYAAATRSLFDVVDPSDKDELDRLLNEASLAAMPADVRERYLANIGRAEAPADNGSTEKSRKKPALVTEPPAPAEFGQLRVTDTPPETREIPNKVIGKPPFMKS